MSTLPPAGWYQQGERGTLTWWDGHTWVPSASEHHATQRTEPVRRPIYWGNLFRFRTLWFLFAGPIVGGALIHMLVPIPPVILWVVLFAGIAWSMVTTQMACRHCGTFLRVTRMTGGQEVCHKCGHLTDKGERETQIQK